MEIFQKAIENEIPLMVFMIAGYPGDTEEDLKESLNFVKSLSAGKPPGGYIFKIGECRVYPKTKTYDLGLSLPDVIFDDDGVFGQNVVRQPSKDLLLRPFWNIPSTFLISLYLTPNSKRRLLM